MPLLVLLTNKHQMFYCCVSFSIHLLSWFITFVGEEHQQRRKQSENVVCVYNPHPAKLIK